MHTNFQHAPCLAQSLRPPFCSAAASPSSRSAPAAAVAEAPAPHQLHVTAAATGYGAAAETPAGWTTVALTNQSEDMRQALLLRFAEGKAMNDLMALMQSGEVDSCPRRTIMANPTLCWA